MVGRCMQILPWGTPWDPSYDHFCVLCQRSNSWYWIFWSIWRSTGPGRYLIFFLVKVPVECRQNHVWGPIFVPSYDHFYNYTSVDPKHIFRQQWAPRLGHQCTALFRTALHNVLLCFTIPCCLMLHRIRLNYDALLCAASAPPWIAFLSGRCANQWNQWNQWKLNAKSMKNSSMANEIKSAALWWRSWCQRTICKSMKSMKSMKTQC